LFDVTLPEITRDAAGDNYGRYRIEPLQPGWGTTLGSSLRRILIAALPGAAVTAIRLAEMPEDPSEVEGIEESLIDLVLNVKQLRFNVPDELLQNGDVRCFLRYEGKGSHELTASELELPEGVEVVNPDLAIATATGKSPFDLELLVEKGKGYSAADTRSEVPADMIPIDAMFTPIPRVNYLIEHTRVGQITDFDRLLLEIWTDGTLQPDDALSQAAKILTQYAVSVASYGRSVADLGIEEIAPQVEEELDRPLEVLNLSMRTANALKRANINTISAVVAMSDNDLLGLRNFGQKSLDELKAALREHGFVTDEDEEAAEADSDEVEDETEQ
jgi:DNA-directed RNA polymerase subunit alpha